MLGFEPRPIKKLGQHWLRDPLSIQKMVSSADLRPSDLVIEIGPGTGIITKHLSREAGEVVAYEIDQTLVTLLREQLHWAQNVQILEQNILANDFELPERSYKVVASLPYYITSPILEKLLTANPIASCIVLMIQREVAEKIVGEPPHSSFLSNFVHAFGTPEIISIVKPEAFSPPPGVDSAILRVQTNPKPEIQKEDIEQFVRLLHAGFTEPRKQLHNSLSAGLHIDTDKSKHLLELSGINSERRAETLKLEEWMTLFEVVKKA